MPTAHSTNLIASDVFSIPRDRAHVAGKVFGSHLVALAEDAHPTAWAQDPHRRRIEQHRRMDELDIPGRNLPEKYWSTASLPVNVQNRD